jgi:hypothetical protein
MTKTTKITIGAIILILIAMVAVIVYNLNDFAAGVIADSRRERNYQKQLLIKFSFKGTVVATEKCSKCEYDGYSAVVKLDTFANPPPILARHYPHYYQLRQDSTFQFAISQNIFGSINSGNLVAKDSNSYSLCFNGLIFELLSRDSLQW